MYTEYYDDMAPITIVILWCEANGVPYRLEDLSGPKDITPISESYK